MHGLKIVLAFRHERVRAGMRALLEVTGKKTVVGETNADESVVNLIKTMKPDVLILEVGFPNSCDQEILTQIRQDELCVKVFVASYNFKNGLAETIFELGASGYLLMEDAANQLNEAVDSIASGETGWKSSSLRRIPSVND